MYVCTYTEHDNASMVACMRSLHTCIHVCIYTYQEHDAHLNGNLNISFKLAQKWRNKCVQP